MWATRAARSLRLASAEATSRPLHSATGTVTCRRCLSRLSRQSLTPKRIPRPASVRPAIRTYSAVVPETIEDGEEPFEFVSEAEAVQAKLLDSAERKVEVYTTALNDTRVDMTVEEQKSRAQTIKELEPLASAWESYNNLRTAILEVQKNLDDPDPTMQEMFVSEHQALLTEFDNLLLVILPRLILPPIPASSLPTILSLTAGIGGGESSRFLEEMSKMYINHANTKGWKVEVLSSAEGAMAKGTGGNGFREMTIRFSPGEWAEEGAECFGELMWEKGTHRVQRVPPGATVTKMHSSTVNINVSPIYEDTDEEPLINPKDVREDVMRASGPGGQHVNKTESAIRLIHIPTGITVSMQDSRSQGQNRELAWSVLRARLSEKKREEEQAARNANRLTAIKGSFRGDKVRTYNFPQDRVTDHRIGFTTNGLESVMSGENFKVVVEAMKQDFTDRRLQALLDGEEDLLE